MLGMLAGVAAGLTPGPPPPGAARRRRDRRRRRRFLIPPWQCPSQLALARGLERCAAGYVSCRVLSRWSLRRGTEKGRQPPGAAAPPAGGDQDGGDGDDDAQADPARAPAPWWASARRGGPAPA